MSYDSAVNYLYSLQKRGIKLGLDNIRKLLSSLGNPQNSFRSIQVAGTNGKGSTSAMTASILHAAGIKTGLFTSPHLVSFTERIRIDNEHITEAEVVELTEEIRNLIQDTGCRLQDNTPLSPPLPRGESKRGRHEPRIAHHEFNPTFFEVVTAMAFLYFQRKGVEWAVVETGLGGRLDATNVLLPEVSVITDINYDHKDFLGNTLAEIAREKAGIIKDGVPVVTSLQEPSVMNVIKNKADEKGAEIFVYGKDFSAAIKTEDPSGSVFSYKGGNNFEDLFIPLSGSHQALNAALALKALEVISGKNLPDLPGIDSGAIRRGLKCVKWPGRLEFVSKEPAVLLDGAHNPQAAEVLADSLKEIFLKRYRRLILIVGAMSDKDIKGIMKPLLPLADEIILTTPAYERASSPQKLAKIACEIGFLNTHVALTVQDAIDMAIKFGELPSGESAYRKNPLAHSPIHPSTDSLILITGSFYTIGEAKEIICGKGILSGLRETL